MKDDLIMNFGAQGNQKSESAPSKKNSLMALMKNKSDALDPSDVFLDFPFDDPLD